MGVCVWYLEYIEIHQVITGTCTGTFPNRGKKIHILIHMYIHIYA